MILIFSAFKSFSIWLKICANFGLEFCMRLLLCRASVIASLSISISGCVNMRSVPVSAELHVGEYTDIYEFGNSRVAPLQGACPEDVRLLPAKPPAKPLNHRR